MSISIGGAGSGLGQLMASLLSRLEQSNDATSTTSTASSAYSTTDSSDGSSPSNALTGSSEASLSDQVIGVLVMMQMSQGSQSASASSSQAGSDPISQAFSGLDSNGDGTISQSELETAIENAGGTAQDADAVYSALGGTSSSGISESTFAQAAQNGAPPPPPPDGGFGGPGGVGGHHHHHHHGGDATRSASDEAAQVFSSLQTNQDGTVSDDALASALGLTSSDGSSSSAAAPSSDGSSNSSANNLISAIDANGDGSVSQSELTNYLESLQQQSQSDQSTLASFWQLANQSYGASQGLFNSSNNQLAMA